MVTLSRHKYGFGQKVTTNNETYKGTVEIVGKLPACCAEHNLPIYACVDGDRHFSFCEESITPLTTTQKRKLN